MSKKLDLALFEKSLLDSFLPWHSKKIILKTYNRYLKRLAEYYPSISKAILSQFVHDIFIFNRGAEIEDFVITAGKISKMVICLKRDKEKSLTQLANLLC